MNLPIKQLAVLFWIAVAGVGVSFAGTVYTAVQQHREKVAAENAPRTIPLPADAGSASGGAAPAAPAQPGQPAPMRPAEPSAH